MKKTGLLSSLLVFSLVFSGCGEAKQQEVSETKEAEATSEAAADEEVANEEASGEETTSEEVTTYYVGTMGTYSPYSYQDEEGNLTGYDLEVLRKVEEIDPTLHFEFAAGAWESLFPGLDANKYQVLANQIISNEEREEKYYLSTNSYYQCVSQIIVKKGNGEGITNLEDMEGKKIGLTVGDSFTNLVEKWNEENGNILDIQMYSEDITTVLQDVANGRIDATVNDPAVALDKAEKQGIEVEAVGERLDASPTYFVFQKNDEGKELRDKVDAALAELKESGELSKLSEEWFGADYTE